MIWYMLIGFFPGTVVGLLVGVLFTLKICNDFYLKKTRMIFNGSSFLSANSPY
jgi:ABC-type nitrate/sulfonate/bicarbonate transport system permease component